MSDTPVAGRHRAAASYNPLTELRSVVATRAGALKAAGALAASGGLAAGLATPATATPAAPAPAQAWVPGGLLAGPVTAVTAPAVQVPVAVHSFGVVSAAAKATAAPKPKAKPVIAPSTIAQQRRTQAVSRSATRTVTRSQATVKTRSTTTTRTSTPTSAPASNSAVVNIAMRYLGITYTYGGSSPATGFDCSGFTSYVFRQVGKSLPRTAEDQRRAVTRVSAPQVGDLVFWGVPAWHVGIYIGNGKVIEASTRMDAMVIRDLWGSGHSYGRP